MSEPIIYTIPSAYYGGVVPKTRNKIEQTNKAQGVVWSMADKLRKVSPRILFFGIIGILFLIVLIVATWYFTRDLRREPEQFSATIPVVEKIRENPPALPELPAVPSDFTDEQGAGDGTSALAEIPLVVPPLIAQPYDDTDNDGLTAAEEELYQTQLTRPDTDNDGFLDGHEVFHLYNPAGVAPERLEETTLVRRFQNEDFGYSLLIPNAWQIVSSAENLNSLTIQTIAGAPVALIVVQNNNEQLPVEEWYKNQNFSQPLSLWETNKAGLRGVVRADKLSAYFGFGNFIYILEHKEVKEKLAYSKIFEVMLNSFQVGK